MRWPGSLTSDRRDFHRGGTPAVGVRRCCVDGCPGGDPNGTAIEPQPDRQHPGCAEGRSLRCRRLCLCVPIENSIEGSVPPTLDSLATGSPLQIYAELTLPVAFSIVTRPGFTAEQVRTLAAFPIAAAQVRNWLARHLPDVDVVPANSNAAAARDVAGSRCDAGVSTALAAQRYGLATLAEGVVDEPNARTRFVLVASQPAPPRTGADRTSVVLRIESARGLWLTP